MVLVDGTPGEIWSYFQRLYISLIFFFPGVPDPEPLFVSRGSWFMSFNPHLCPPVHFLFPWVLNPVIISNSSLLSCWNASGSLVAALDSRFISLRSLIKIYCVHSLCFLHSLFVFLHCLFTSGGSLFISPNRLFIVTVFHVHSPDIFCSFPLISFRVSNFCAYFPVALQFLEFPFVSIFLFISVNFVFFSEPLAFFSSTKTH